MTQAIVDAAGNYLTSIDDAAPTPAIDPATGAPWPIGFQRVPSAPTNAAQTWNGNTWSAPPALVGDPTAIFLVAVGAKTGLPVPQSVQNAANPSAVVVTPPAV